MGKLFAIVHGVHCALKTSYFRNRYREGRDENRAKTFPAKLAASRSHLSFFREIVYVALSFFVAASFMRLSFRFKSNDVCFSRHVMNFRVGKFSEIDGAHSTVAKLFAL